MRLTGERRTLVVVLGLAALALGVDRFVLSGSVLGPQGALATSASQLAAAVEKAVSVDAAAEAVRERTIAERLSMLSGEQPTDPEALRDIFLALDPLAGPAAAERDAPADPNAPFEKRHKLTMVMRSGGEEIAVVGGHRLRVGDELDGHRLTECGPGFAVFVKDGATVRLDVSNSLLPGSGPAPR